MKDIHKSEQEGTALRTHRCGEVSAALVGQTVSVAGWAARVRNLGGVVFVDLRDRYGELQVVCRDGEPLAMAGDFKLESVLAFTGEVRRRPEGMVNPDKATGEVELVARSAVILNGCAPLPFQLDQADRAGEELRLKYRYIHLRRPDMLRNLEIRHRAAQAARRYLSDRGFLEVETPLLIRTTPEGARDYVVPSRIHHGQFYALPQSPQLYKQILMAGGVDRYFQLARCLRDEDLRKDRQPEHTQIDLEMSFVGEDEIFDVVERMLATVFDKAMDRELPTPFPRMSFHEAMDLYGSDKPDLRFALEMVDLGEIAAVSEFQAFRSVVEGGGVVRGLRVPGASGFSRKEIEELEKAAKTYRAKGLAWMKVGDEGLTGGVSKFFGGAVEARLREALSLESGDLVLMVGDRWETACQSLGAVRSALGKKLGLIAEGEFKFLWVHRFPLFEWDEDKERWQAMHHLFTMPCPEDFEHLESDPGKVHGQLYDLVCNGVELASGSIRIHRRDIQERVMAVVGIDKEEAQERFGFLLGAFDFGAPPHGGIAPGLDRLLMVLDGGDSIRDYIAFPKTLQAKSLMVDAPAPIGEDQLRELGLRIAVDES